VVKARTLAVALGITLAGCAAQDARVLHMQPDAGAAAVFWPAAPEVPRYLYAGQLVGEGNYVDAAGATRGRLRSALEWIAGIGAPGSELSGLLRPQSGATDEEGRVYVSDASRQAVMVFDPTHGLQTWTQAEGLAAFSVPVGIAVAPGGRVFVADAGLGIVARLDRDGRTQPAIGRGALRRPTGVAFDPASGRLFVVDTHAHDVKVFDGDGRLAATYGRRGEGEGEFNYPTHIAYARGELYVADTMNSRVQVLDASDGRHRLTLGARGLNLGNLVRPKGVSVDSEGNIYVVESYFDHLLVYDRGGAFLLAIGGLGSDVGQFYLPAGVWTDSRNRVFVADMFNGRVVVMQFLGGDGAR
jgi:DNA-binding beta-propeller fold protein YncE